MTNQFDPDLNKKNTYLPFAPGDLDRCGLRLTRAEFARFLGVSKQAVGEWVTSGKITLGTDGRLDPRQAVSQLMRNADPARLRSKVLAPLMKEVGAMQKRIAELESELKAVTEDADFHEGSSLEFLAQQEKLMERLQDERDELAALPAGRVVDGIIAWIDDAFFSDFPTDGLLIADCIPSDAPGIEEKGEG